MEISLAETLYEIVLGRKIDSHTIETMKTSSSFANVTPLQFAVQLMSSSECLGKMVLKAKELHPYLIHGARVKMVKSLLPDADRILDLGGANAPLYATGYAYPFKQMVLIDLPPDDRHAMYKNLKVNSATGDPRVEIHYGDMANLDRYPDGSFDLVWSGQSIEHIDEAAGLRMCRESFRVLRPGGFFCLDTPNRGITKIHTQDSGSGFIHPEHMHEYYPKELKEILNSIGFSVTLEKGICEMRATRTKGIFDYTDFVLGSPIVADADDGYVFFLQCEKPQVAARI